MILSELKSLLIYDPVTGVWRWLVDRGNRFKTGTVAGSINEKGYWIIGVLGRNYKAHRLAVFYMTGEWPKDQVDHNDLHKANNRWGNIRPAINSQNQMNGPVRSDNKLGLKGIKEHKPTGLFQARITVNGKRQSLGYFKSTSEAIDARRNAAYKIHGNFTRES